MILQEHCRMVIVETSHPSYSQTPTGQPSNLLFLLFMVSFRTLLVFSFLFLIITSVPSKCDYMRSVRYTRQHLEYPDTS